ncbi:MAG: transglutaminase-like domain-containing protein [Planctomycetes bacterium]|nr:transglutaminase-like domain-containing protein [Planctomycetota bacterium]
MTKAILFASILASVVLVREASSGTLRDAMVAADKLPDGFTLDREVIVAEQNLRGFTALLGVSVRGVANQYLTKSEESVRVNTILLHDKNDRETAFRALLSKVGAVNAVLRGEEAVYEIIAQSVAHKKQIATAIPTLYLERFKLVGGEFPEGFSLANEMLVPENQLAGMNRALGATPRSVLNQIFQKGNLPAQLNLIELETEAAAERAAVALGRMHSLEPTRVGKVAFEIISSRAEYRALLRAIVLCEQIPALKTTYNMRVTLALGPRDIRAETITEIFQRVLEVQGGDQPDELTRTLSALRYSNSLKLWNSRRQYLRREMNFEPAARNIENSDEYMVLNFDPTFELFGAPAVRASVKAQVTSVRPEDLESADELPDEKRLALTRATSFFPADADAVKSLVAPIAAANADELARLGALLDLVRQKVAYGGNNRGSRNGCLETLRDGTGHCWDFSDVCVTFARAAGLPARQLAGWLYGSSGHVWCEVFIRGRGWIPVDATLGRLGVDERYIPLFGTDDGRLEFLWLSKPEITTE